jgi:hypothetical protein
MRWSKLKQQVEAMFAAEIRGRVEFCSFAASIASSAHPCVIRGIDR